MSHQDNAAWRRCWRDQQIGEFHQTETNALLMQCWPRLGLPPGSRVFVPLCGKSLDLVWLAAQGHDVFGVELSTVAAGDFFRERGLRPERHSNGRFSLFSAGRISIAAGDFFRLCAADLGPVAAVYDRAALTALPPHERVRYAAHLTNILPAAAVMLLLTTEDDGPRSAPDGSGGVDEEVARLYAGNYDVDLLQARDLPNPAGSGAAATGQLKAYRLSPRG